MSGTENFVAAQRFHVAVEGRQAAQSLAIRLCEQWRQNDSSVATLQTDAAFLSNLNIAQNLVLPAAWQTGQTPAALLAQARQLYAHWAPEGPLLDNMLDARPFAVSDASRRVLVLLQAALCRPQHLLMLPDWFAAPPSPDTPWWQLQQQTFLSVPWICLSASAPVLLPQQAWVAASVGPEGKLHVE